VEVVVTRREFAEQIDSRIARYDLLSHPFYQAWSLGQLKRQDLRAYAQDYYHHVKAFPIYLARFAARLEEGPVRAAVLANMTDEMGMGPRAGSGGRAHSDLWQDFAAGMGFSGDLDNHEPTCEVKDLITFFTHVACCGTPGEALASFYAYESQVPRLAKEKARGLHALYGADARTRRYFTLHETADLYHSKVWRTLLETEVTACPESAPCALDAAEKAASALWRTLDGMENRRGLTARRS
jgi:pyrroloquinoline-quinone synthase